jgi:hypothetical protein
VPKRGSVGGSCRSEGASEERLEVVASADAMQFVGTRRLEEAWPGYSWRSAFSPGFLA